MVLLESDAFLSELTRLFQKQKSLPAGCGSISMAMKRYDGRTKPKPRPSKAQQQHHNEPIEFKCLIRASLGNKKIATVVGQKDVNRFQMAYANLLKGNIDGLKKKEKKSAKGKVGKVKTAKAT